MKLATFIGVLLTATLPVVTGFFIIPCDGPLAVERSDPIVSPGGVATHLHTIFGGNGFNFTMNYASTRASTCTSCMVAQDLSNYWVPHLFYKAKNGSYHPVRNNGARIYYLQRFSSIRKETLQPFPAGFRMFAGDPNLRTWTPTAAQKAISFACLNYNPPKSGVPGEQHSIHDVNLCLDGLRAQVFFPSCWNGRDLDSADHKSHMAYPDQGTGACPATHPVRFVSLFYEVFFDIGQWKNEWYGAGHPFVLSTGDAKGYSFHGDFINGWDVNVLRRALHECTDDTVQGDLQKCPPLKLMPDEVISDCATDPRIDEQVDGWMPKLPGCNPQRGDCRDTATIGHPKRYYTDMTKRGWKYVGCALDKLDDRTLPVRWGKDDMTIEKCLNYCVSQGQTYAGLEWSVECYCGKSIDKGRLGWHQCRTPCGGDSTQYCGGARKLSVYKKM